jgi:hypothetical protein
MDFVYPDYEEFHTKLVFYRIPKNASTSIYEHLGFSNLIWRNKEEISSKVDQRVYKNTFEPSHLKPNELKNLVLGNELRGVFSFCVVRNPWDRAVSMYLHALDNNFKETYKVKEDITFEFFCNFSKERRNDPYFIGSHKQTEWTVGDFPPTKILRFENLNEDFSRMISEHKIVTVNPKLPHLNKTKHTHYSDYYNSETKKIISDVFEEDIDTFEYSFTRKDPCSLEPKVSQGSLRI